jgi:hypothetical protein
MAAASGCGAAASPTGRARMTMIGQTRRAHGARLSKSAHLIGSLFGCGGPIYLSSSIFRSVVPGDTMTPTTDVQGLQGKAEARLASLQEEKLVTRIAVLSTLLGQDKVTERLMIGMSVETHKTSPDFDQKKCSQAKSRIMQALGDIDCDVFIEMDR